MKRILVYQHAEEGVNTKKNGLANSFNPLPA
jgi:hypothetical protein